MVELEKAKDSLSSGAWHFNAGLLKAKMQNPAEARYHFLKSRFEGFRNEKLDQNLDLIEEELQVKTVEKPLEVSDYAVKFCLWSTNGFFTTISLLILVCGLLILKRERKPLVLILTLVLMLIPVGMDFWVRSWDKAVNLNAQEVLEGPSAIFPSRGELPAGVLVITRRAGDWYEILYPARFRGWVKGARGIKELE